MFAASWPTLGQMTGPRAGEHHLDFQPIDTSQAVAALRAAETVYQLAMQQNPQEVEVSQELLVYPEGEGDAVTISERDMEGLQPKGDLSNNIVDFYIRYLERRLAPENRKRLYFFNSFFFTKLLMSTASTSIDPCKVDYEQLRNWTGRVNLFEKDYVFIPILKSSHWSLVIICHLGSLTSSCGERKGSPCMLHLDPIEGYHESFEGQVRSYLLQSWMERSQGSSNRDELLALCQMKYVQAEVPQQDNKHDCGLYLLNYIEAFVVESTSPDFTFVLSERGPPFTSPHFAREVCAKRMHIQNLILELIRISEDRAAKRRAMKHLVEELRQISQKLHACLEDEGDVFSTRKGNSEGCIGDVQNNSPIIFNGQDSEMKHASTCQYAIDTQQSTWESGLDDVPQDGAKISHTEDQNSGEILSDREQPVEHEKVPCMVLCETPKGKNKRGRNWTEEETSILLSCKVEGGRFWKHRQGATCWKAICQEIEKKFGTTPSEDQCRLRYDTLLKAYKTYKKYYLRTGKTVFEITKDERVELKLATVLSKEWYTVIDEICCRRPHNAKLQKRMKPSPSVCNEGHPLNQRSSLLCSPASPTPNRSSDPKSSFQEDGKVELCSLDEELRSTFFNLCQAFSMKNWWFRVNAHKMEEVCDMELVCRKLAIVQDQTPSEIRRHVLKLWELKFVKMMDMGFGEDTKRLNHWMEKKWLYLWMPDKLTLEVLQENPYFNTYQRISYYDEFRSIEPSSFQRIRVLSLDQCRELMDIDLKKFPELRYLDIKNCAKLEVVTGWEVVKELGWLEIGYCSSYNDAPDLRHLFSLREFRFHSTRAYRSSLVFPMLDVKQCEELRRLEIFWDGCLSKSMDLKALKFLEVLSFEGCFNLSTIEGGFSGLHALTQLNLSQCGRLRMVPELGCLKAMTHLDMSCSGVEEIQGTEELHLLTSLNLWLCRSLKRLPFLGHLKVLANLDLSFSAVEEIPGVEELVSLKTLRCTGSKLKWLPNLQHLRQLQGVWVVDTPLSNNFNPMKEAGIHLITTFLCTGS